MDDTPPTTPSKHKKKETPAIPKDLQSQVRYDGEHNGKSNKKQKLQNMVIRLVPHPLAGRPLSELRAPYLTTPPNLNIGSLQVYLGRKLRLNDGSEFRLSLQSDKKPEQLLEETTISHIYNKLIPGHEDIVLYYYTIINHKHKQKLRGADG